jgi:tetratricopeptide (TPR) repeat protein
MVRGRLQWAQALYDRQRYDDAKTALREVLKLAPSNAEARQLAALIDNSASGVVPAPGTSSAPERDRQAALSLLGRYETAFEQGDITALKAVWPSVDPREMSERWQAGRPGQLALRLVDLEVTGDEAVALCVAYEDTLATNGQKVQGNSRVRFHLRRTNGSWTIDSVK